MKKQFLAILLVMCLVIGSCPVWAVASNDDFVIENGVLLKYTGTSKNVTIPSGITSIGDRAFRECHFLFRIVFPDTLKRIGNRAFEKCDSLVSVSIPNTVISIGDDAFSDCDSLNEVTIPSNVTSIGNNPFGHCGNLERIEVNDGNSFFSSYDGVLFDARANRLLAYPKGKSATSYKIPSSVTTIANSAFGGCNLKNIIIPNSVIHIDKYAFWDCELLEDLMLPSSINQIGEGAFGSCNNLKRIEINKLNSDFFSVDGVLFNDSKDELVCYPAGKIDSSFTIPRGVKKIWPEAFSYCAKLTSVVIPTGVTTIDGSFNGCQSLGSIHIPRTVTSIRAASFAKCNSLSEIFYDGSETQWKQIEIDYLENESLIFSTVHYKNIGSDNTPDTTHTPGPIADDFPSEITPITSKTIYNGHTFQILYSSYGWDEMQAYLKTTGGYLACITSAAENQWIHDYASRNGASNAWFGYSDAEDEGNWKWVSGETSSYTNWAPGEPNNEGGREHYAGYYFGDGTWNDGTYPSNCYYLCEWPKIISSVDPVPTIAPSPSSGPDIGTSNSIQPKSRMFIPVGESLDLTADIVIKTLVPGDTVHWTVKSNDNVRLSQDGALEVTRPLGTVPNSGIVQNTVRLYGNSVGSAKIECRLTSGAKQQFEVVVYREERKNLQDFAKNVLVGYQQYIEAVKKAMKENRNTVTMASIQQQAELLREADKNNNEKLISFYNHNESEKSIQNVYTAVAQFMAETTAGEFDLSDISVKDLDKFSTNIVNKLYSSFDIKPYRYTYGGDTVIIGGFSGVGANLRSIDYKPAKGKSRTIAAFVTTKSQAQAVIKKYLQDLLSVEKKLINKAYAEMAKEIFGKGLDSLVKSKITELVKPYTTAVEQCGLGRIDNVIIKSIDYYKYVKKILAMADEDPISLLNDLSSMEKLKFTPDSITNATVNTSMTAYESAKKNFEAAIYEYVTTGKVDTNSKIRNVWDDTINSLTADLNCPVDVSVYDASGQLIGFVGENDLWFTDGKVYIEKVGDTKRIQSADEFTLKAVATDTGVLNCTFKEYNGENQTGRTTYFDIDLFRGKEISARLPKNAVSQKSVAMEANGKLLSPSNIFMSDEYGLSTVNITSAPNMSQGGVVTGTGKYVLGDSVKLQADPKPGYEFLGWQNIDGAYEEVSPIYEFVAKEDIFVTAVFYERSENEDLDTPWDSPSNSPKPSNPSSLEPTTSPSPSPSNSPEPSNPPSAEPTSSPSLSPSPWDNTFPDVPNTAWYIKAVEYVVTEGLMGGYPNGKFGPNDNISRAEFAQIIYNKAGRPGAGTSVFTDVKAGQWYANAVTWAAEQQVVSGIGNNQFAPNRDISREELATMLWRYAKSPKPQKGVLDFADANKVSNFAKEAMLWANEDGIVNGKGSGILDPKGKATRAETAQMLMNFLIKSTTSMSIYSQL